MFDSWGKLPSGIFFGTSFEFGNFDQCLEILEQPDDVSVGEIKGQYCLTTLGGGDDATSPLSS